MIDMRKDAQTSRSALLDVLMRRHAERRPIWLMRQAGRYLPEYRAVREKAGSFLDLCYNNIGTTMEGKVEWHLRFTTWQVLFVCLCVCVCVCVCVCMSNKFKKIMPRI